MVFEQNKTQKSFDMASCLEMMEKAMGQHGEGCNCTKMMSQITDQEGIPDEWLKVMSQMMDIYCRPEEKAEQEVQSA